MTLILINPLRAAKAVAEAAKQKRLSLDFSQKSLSERSGVSLGVIKRFEGSGKISLESLLKLALILGSLNDFLKLFEPTNPEEFRTLDELLKEQKKRKRGRK
jgi:transcriptional regulator with XRE-family HTH domain